MLSDKIISHFKDRKMSVSYFPSFCILGVLSPSKTSRLQLLYCIKIDYYSFIAYDNLSLVGLAQKGHLFGGFKMQDSLKNVTALYL